MTLAGGKVNKYTALSPCIDEYIGFVFVVSTTDLQNPAAGGVDCFKPS